jgi:hypothetical protein
MTVDRVTDGTAVVAISYPLWLDQLHNGAEWLVPIMGVFWLGLQIYFKIKHENHKDD